jgi:cytochrome P450
MKNDAKMLGLPNALPPRLPIIAHAQIFWRDYYRIPAERAYNRLQLLTTTAQGVIGDAGLTRYWLRPWGPPIVYVSNPHSIRDMFMLEEFIEVYIGGRACRCLPNSLLSCGFGHPMNLLGVLLLQEEVLEMEAQTFVKYSTSLTARVLAHPNSKLDMLPMIDEVVLDAVCAYAVGPDFRADAALRKHFDTAVDGAAAVLCAPPPAFPFTSWLWKYITPEGRILGHAARNIEQQLVAEVARRRRRMGDSAATTAKAVCLADYMLVRYPGARDEEIAEDLVAFMVQRYSVLAPGIVWSLREILTEARGKLPRIIRTEGITASSALRGKASSTLSVKDRMGLNMPTLERCVRESLRLHPPAPALVPLMLLKDAKLSGYTVKAGSEIRLLPYMVQRSGKYWKKYDELLFKEERWSEQARTVHKHFSHYAFGAGLLTCATPESARKGIQQFCYSLLKEFNMSVDDDREGMESIRTSVLLPSNGLTLVFKKLSTLNNS